MDSFSCSLQNLDLLDTVLADFATGKLKTCDIDITGSRLEDSNNIDKQSSVERSRSCDDRPEQLSETCQTVLLSASNKTQSTLSEGFCDEIFNELEKTATFHKFTDWSSDTENKFDYFQQEIQETKEKDSR